MVLEEKELKLVVGRCVEEGWGSTTKVDIRGDINNPMAMSEGDSKSREDKFGC